MTSTYTTTTNKPTTLSRVKHQLRLERRHRCSDQERRLDALGIPHGFHNAGEELLTLLDLHTYQFDDVPPSKLGVAEVTYGLQGGVEAHAHSDREKAYYIISGQASVKIGEEEAALGAGSVAFIPRHVTHAYRNVGDEPLKLAVVSSYDV